MSIVPGKDRNPRRPVLDGRGPSNTVLSVDLTSRVIYRQAEPSTVSLKSNFKPWHRTVF